MAVISLAFWITIITVAAIHYGDAMLLITSMMAVIVTILLCRFRGAHKKPLSYGTLFAGPFGSAFLALVCERFYDVGWRIFTNYYWLHVKGGLSVFFTETVFLGCICVPPAIAIVVYYQSKINKQNLA